MAQPTERTKAAAESFRRAQFSKGYVNEAGAACIVVEISPQVLTDLKRLVATGLFGFTVGDCATRFIDQAVQAKAFEGWLPMPVFAEPKLAAKNRRRR